jgi:hypothetical protein
MFHLPHQNVFTYLSRLIPSFQTSPINIPSVAIHDIETTSDRRARTLKHLIKANHANFSILFHGLRFHNHTAHILGSAFLLGGSSEHLNDVYEKETKGLEAWSDAPGEVTLGEWRDFLGKKE